MAAKKRTATSAGGNGQSFGAGLLDEVDETIAEARRVTTTKPKAIRAAPITDPHVSKGNAAEALHAMETRAPTVNKPIVLPELDIKTLQITLVGDSPLICHRWSEKAKRMLLGRQTGEAEIGKEPKNPVEDYQSSLYVLKPAPKGAPFEDSTFGLPTIGFKKCAVAACTSLGKSITKVAARQAFHVVGEYVPVKGRPRMRDDMVRVGQGTADIRFRGEFPEWEVTLTIRYNARVLSDRQLVNLFQTAGFAVGVFEWRSECDGQMGLFHVKKEDE